MIRFKQANQPKPRAPKSEVGHSETFKLRISPDLLNRISASAKAQGITAAQAFRHAAEIWLKSANQ